ncbi:serine/threonine protein phosphatase [Suicoccus acidiformans]|uniref:Serine/threonine protein phosphatase n=1 Tax=Suicoccus acidiformans TaxID=2036206 RepID=A0A347WKI7_9LACT|nr:Stp1/IreP family PP2C-type Ser/Thr phosphatase [Suicoccus acidiformans]AXY25594.1 serine/threonine protein phosphatase [Suicoccus acidiformans]
MQISIHTNVGKQRSSNQDYADYFMNDFDQPLFVLCDGVGGHQAGDVASQLTTEYLGNIFQELEDALTADSVSVWLHNAIHSVNQYIYDTSIKRSDLEGMGTTLVMGTIVEDVLYIAHVGDSRAYVYSNGRLAQMTEDHSLVNELIKSGEITEAEGEVHPRRNVVTQSIGVTESVGYELTQVSIYEIDIVMFCSDGLTNMVSKETLEAFFAANESSDDLSQDLVNAANEAGGLDNITVIIASHFQDTLGEGA